MAIDVSKVTDRLRMDKRVTLYVLLPFIRDQGINMRLKQRKGKIKRGPIKT